jgi:hypothetical protein
MEKNIYPFDPDVVVSSTRFGKELGKAMIRIAIEEIYLEKDFVSNNCRIFDIDVQNLDANFVYNWVFQGVMDVLRKPETRQEIQRLILDAKKIEEV